jgi:multiphosphoryl transfer protein
MVSLRAPLSGVVWPLERIPDPVFAQKMVGDGASIDPIDAVLVAPCDGDVLSLHPAGHAVTLSTAEGAEILLHIGIDTVTLKGKGFHPMVSAGETVRAGAPLIEFDLDYLATHAKSLLTQIVITNGDGLRNWQRASGQVVAGKDLLFSVNFVSSDKGGATEAETITSDAIVIPNPTGLHARPAAVLANLAKGFRSSIKLQLGDQQVNARSITAIMGLDVRSGASVRLLASGPDARAAIDKIAPVVAQGLGDEGYTPAPAPATTTAAPESAPPPRRKSTDPNLLLGVACSPGLAVGQVFQVRRDMIEVTEEGA